jgi:glycosyltransferase involved in cell wall biosynthesis
MPEPIRVLQIFTVLNRGGAETNIMNYYRKINRTKIQFDFLVHREEIGAYEQEILNLGGRIFRLPPINPFKLKNYKKQLNYFFDTNNYSIIHGHSCELGFYIYKEAFKRKVPVVIAHGHYTKHIYDLKLPFKLFWKKSMLKYLNTYFSCGQQASISLFGNQIANQAFIMKNAIDSNDFKYNKILDSEKRLELNAQQTLNFVNVGSFVKSKNHVFAIDVFNEFLKIHPNSKMFFVGKGNLFESLKNKINKLNLEEKIIFLGVRNDVNQVLQAMDFLLFPSIDEGLPVSLIEAQAAGLKCFISDGVPLESILINENVEVIALKKSTKFWAEQIYKSINFKKQDMSKKIIESGYDINLNSMILENKYLELLANNS